MMKGDDLRDPIFKGCTRPAMVFGVPLVPLTIIGSTIILISIWTTILVAFLLIPIILTMQQITKSDDQKFRLLGLKFLFQIIHYNHNGRFWKSSAYGPLQFKQRK